MDEGQRINQHNSENYFIRFKISTGFRVEIRCDRCKGVTKKEFSEEEIQKKQNVWCANCVTPISRCFIFEKQLKSFKYKDRYSHKPKTPPIPPTRSQERTRNVSSSGIEEFYIEPIKIEEKVASSNSNRSQKKSSKTKKRIKFLIIISIFLTFSIIAIDWANKFIYTDYGRELNALIGNIMTSIKIPGSYIILFIIAALIEGLLLLMCYLLLDYGDKVYRENRRHRHAIE